MRFFVHDIEAENAHYEFDDDTITRIVREPDGFHMATVHPDISERIYIVLRNAGKWDLNNEECANFAYDLIFGLGDESRAPVDSLAYEWTEKSFNEAPVFEGGWREVLQLIEQLYREA